MIALALALAAVSVSCGNKSPAGQSQAAGAPSGKSQADQLAALDSAYQSGVFTKEEYDAKKAAILGQAVPAPAPAPSPEPLPQATPPAPAAEDPPIASSAPSVQTQAVPEPAAQPSAAQPTAASPPVPRVKPAPAAPTAKTAPTTQAESEPAPSHGCEDAEYRTRKDEGPQSRFFPMPVARVKKAALAALDTLDFNIHKQDGNEIEASKKRHLGVVVGAGGEREILQFEAATQGGQRGTRVTGETKKSVMGRLAQKSWTAAVLAQTACNLRELLGGRKPHGHPASRREMHLKHGRGVHAPLLDVVCFGFVPASEASA